MHFIPSLVLGTVDPPRFPAPSDLVDRLVAGEEAAYGELVRLHGPRMLSVAGRYLSRPADAEDALQDAFVNVVRSIGRFQRASTLETWLHRIVVNCSLMSLRRQRRRPETLLEDSAVESGAASRWKCWPPSSAHDAVVAAEISTVVRRSVDRLPPTQRSTLLLREVDSLALKEIASLLDVGVSTVKIRLHRARRSLRRTLGRSLDPTSR